MHIRHYQNRTNEWCRYSDYAFTNLRPQKPYRIGRLLRRGYARVTSYSNGHPYAVVLWNGNRTPTHYHEDFIAVIGSSDEIPGIPKLPVWPHMLRSFAWRS